jgi:predicted transcriptional regulator YdeE
MKLKLVEKDTFYLCGYLVETTSEQNDKQVSELYDDFFCNNKGAALMKLKGSKTGYYGLMWYTLDHDRYCYLLGVEVGQYNTAPETAILKEIPKTTYAVVRFRQGEDIIKAWTELFYNEIPKAGLKVNEWHNLYFEYYPDNVYGDYELWVPVVQKVILKEQLAEITRHQ